METELQLKYSFVGKQGNRTVENVKELWCNNNNASNKNAKL